MTPTSVSDCTCGHVNVRSGVGSKKMYYSESCDDQYFRVYFQDHLTLIHLCYWQGRVVVREVEKEKHNRSNDVYNTALP